MDAVGRLGAMNPAGSVEPVLLGTRIEYRRADSVEWYIDTIHGLEQGFDIRGGRGWTSPSRPS
ncbi:MAG: hypothetical protein ACI9WU_004060 [Myxococcota bacterium]|jgi:hypothetical protein